MNFGGMNGVRRFVLYGSERWRKEVTTNTV